MDKDLCMEYIKRFGAAAFPPRFQMRPEQNSDDFIEKLLKRCLREGKPASEYIAVENDPNVIY